MVFYFFINVRIFFLNVLCGYKCGKRKLIQGKCIGVCQCGICPNIENDMSWHYGEMFYESIYATCENYKICYIHGTQDFCIAHIKYMKLCSPFSQPYSKS